MMEEMFVVLFWWWRDTEIEMILKKNDRLPTQTGP